eukprot:GILI01031990.1.p1 GENE.GILI01031990.1~~GILI01031990.1.p1  ORF type:complete len:201 (+),score=18.98 GILI01031990.1:69-671(+)
MLLNFDSRVRTDLGLVPSLPLEFFQEFCRLSLSLIEDKTTKRNFGKAAEQLGVDASAVEGVIYSLSWVLSESSKLLLSEEELEASLSSLQWPQEHLQSFSHVFAESRETIRGVLSNTVTKFVEYRDLTWRLDMQVGTRSTPRCMNPMFLLKLDVTDIDNQPQSFMLQSDFANVKNLCSSLEKALQEASSTHARRMMKYIQ